MTASRYRMLTTTLMLRAARRVQRSDVAVRDGGVVSARIEVIVPRQSTHTVTLPTVVTSAVARS